MMDYVWSWLEVHLLQSLCQLPDMGRCCAAASAHNADAQFADMLQMKFCKLFRSEVIMGSSINNAW